MLPNNSSPDSPEKKDSAPLNQDGASKKKKSPYSSKSLKEIAAELGVGIAVARKWVKEVPEVGKRIGRYFNPKQVYAIFKMHGHPDGLLE